MSLQVWLPLTKDLRQQGLNSTTIEEVTSAVFDNSGKLGKCLSGGKIKIPANQVASIFNNTSMSIAFWYNNNTSETTGNHAICGFSGNGEGDTDAVRIWDFFNYSNPNTFHWSMGTLGGGSLSNIFPANTWVHVCVTWNAPTLKIYMDGVLKYTGSGSSNYTFDKSYYISFGRTPQKLNDFRIYNHCLSPMEVKELAKGLVLHYPLNRQGWGQENLLLNSNDLTLWPIESSGQIELQEDGYFKVSSKASNTTRYGIYYDFTFPEPDTYTFSVDVRDDWLIGVAPASTFTWTTANLSGTQGKKRISYTCTSTEENNKCRIYIAGTGTGGRVTYLKQPKLEKGSIATPWCPNSADALATTMGLNSTTEYDCSGFCNNGTKTGTFTYTSDTSKYQVSTNFNDTTTITSLSTYDRTLILPEYTIAVWVKTSSIPSAGSYFYKGLIDLYFTTSGTLTYMYGSSSSGGNGSSVVYTLGEWIHIVVTRDNTGLFTVYINGVNKYTTTRDMYARYTTDVLGYNKSFTGQLSDFRIYATALSADEAISLYQNNAYIDDSGNIHGQIH